MRNSLGGPCGIILQSSQHALATSVIQLLWPRTLEQQVVGCLPAPMRYLGNAQRLQLTCLQKAEQVGPFDRDPRCVIHLGISSRIIANIPEVGTITNSPREPPPYPPTMTKLQHQLKVRPVSHRNSVPDAAHRQRISQVNTWLDTHDPLTGESPSRLSGCCTNMLHKASFSHGAKQRSPSISSIHCKVAPCAIGLLVGPSLKELLHNIREHPWRIPLKPTQTVLDSRLGGPLQECCLHRCKGKPIKR